MKSIKLLMVLIGSLVFARTALAEWSTVQRITWTPGGSLSPAIAIGSGGVIHVVWHDGTVGNYEIYYKRSTDGGDSWSPSKRLTWTAAASELPAIAVDGVDRIHVVWDDWTPGNTDIYYRRSMTGGASWAPTQRLTRTSGHSFYPAIACSPAGHLHVVWSDDTSGEYEVYYRAGADGGANWSSSQRLTWNSGYSSSPAIAFDGSGDLHVVWSDLTPGNFEIYYMRDH